jgi:hypothetical protein
VDIPHRITGQAQNLFQMNGGGENVCSIPSE